MTGRDLGGDGTQGRASPASPCCASGRPLRPSPGSSTPRSPRGSCPARASRLLPRAPSTSSTRRLGGGRRERTSPRGTSSPCRPEAPASRVTHRGLARPPAGRPTPVGTWRAPCALGVWTSADGAVRTAMKTDVARLGATRGPESCDPRGRPLRERGSVPRSVASPSQEAVDGQGCRGRRGHRARVGPGSRRRTDGEWALRRSRRHGRGTRRSGRPSPERHQQPRARVDRGKCGPRGGREVRRLPLPRGRHHASGLRLQRLRRRTCTRSSGCRFPDSSSAYYSIGTRRLRGGCATRRPHRLERARGASTPAATCRSTRPRPGKTVQFRSIWQTSYIFVRVS